MQLHFVGKNLDVTEALKNYTTDKFKSIEKRYPSITQIQIVFYIEHIMQVAEATCHMHGSEVHASSKEDDMYKAIDALEAKLMTLLTKHKEKLIDSHR